MREAVIVSSPRTPLAKSHRGSFNMTRPDDFAAHAIRHALGKAPRLDPAEVDEVILGCGMPNGPAGHNIARVAALRAGLLYMAMGDTAEVVAKRYGITRESQDEYALISQQRTARAQQEGFFAGELAPLTVRRAILDKKTGEKAGDEEASVGRDECNRPDTTIEGLRKLAPVFDAASGHGSVTAGNASQLSDGASAALVMSSARASALGLVPRLVFRGYAVSGCEPDEMGIGPVFASPSFFGHMACAWTTSTCGS